MKNCENCDKFEQKSWICLPGFDLEGYFCLDCVHQSISESLNWLKSYVKEDTSEDFDIVGVIFE
jgi:predicted nucleotidyltransferase